MVFFCATYFNTTLWIYIILGLSVWLDTVSDLILVVFQGWVM